MGVFQLVLEERTQGEEPAILLCWGCEMHTCHEPADSGLGFELRYQDPRGPGVGED